LIGLAGLLSFGSAGAQSLAAPSRDGTDAEAARSSACVTDATRSVSIECLEADFEELVDPDGDGHGQATAESVGLSPVVPEAFVSFRSRGTLPIPTRLVDTAPARAPPST